MKVWFLIIDDKHCDVEVQAFTTPEAAIAEAKSFLGSVAPDEWEQWEGNPKAFYFFAYYNGDENTVRVIEGTLSGL